MHCSVLQPCAAVVFTKSNLEGTTARLSESSSAHSRTMRIGRAMPHSARRRRMTLSVHCSSLLRISTTKPGHDRVRDAERGVSRWPACGAGLVLTHGTYSLHTSS